MWAGVDRILSIVEIIHPTLDSLFFLSENPKPSLSPYLPFLLSPGTVSVVVAMYNLAFWPFVSNHISKVNIFELPTIIALQDVRGSKQRENI